MHLLPESVIGMGMPSCLSSQNFLQPGFKTM